MLLLMSKVSKRGHVNSHYASSEVTEIPAGDGKGREREGKERKKEATLGSDQPLAHMHQSTH